MKAASLFCNPSCLLQAAGIAFSRCKQMAVPGVLTARPHARAVPCSHPSVPTGNTQLQTVEHSLARGCCMDMCGTTLCLGSLAGQWEPGSLLGSLRMFFQHPGGTPDLIERSHFASQQRTNNSLPTVEVHPSVRGELRPGVCGTW